MGISNNLSQVARLFRLPVIVLQTSNSPSMGRRSLFPKVDFSGHFIAIPFCDDHDIGTALIQACEAAGATIPRSFRFVASTTLFS